MRARRSSVMPSQPKLTLPRSLSHRSSGRLTMLVSFTNLDGMVKDKRVLEKYLAIFDECRPVTELQVHPAMAEHHPEPAAAETNLCMAQHTVTKMAWIDSVSGAVRPAAAGPVVDLRHKYKSTYMKRSFTRDEALCLYKHLNRMIPGIDLSLNTVALVNNHVWKAQWASARHVLFIGGYRGARSERFNPSTTLHDIRWGEHYTGEGVDDYAGTLIVLIEVDERSPWVEFGLGCLCEDGRAFGVVEQTFHQVGGRGHLFAAVLVLDADRVTAEVRGDAHGGDIHSALVEDLIECELNRWIGAKVEGDTAIDGPLVDAMSFVVVYGAHLCDERGLAQALIVDACGIEQFIVDDGVLHAHVVPVQDAEDGFALLRFVASFLARVADWAGTSDGSRGRMWRRSCVTLELPTHSARPVRKKLSVKSRLQREENFTLALTSEPLRLSRATRPGHCPDQLATVRMGPRRLPRPGRTWWLYCQAAVAKMSLVSGGRCMKMSIPMRCEEMNPCPVLGSTGKARTRVYRHRLRRR